MALARDARLPVIAPNRHAAELGALATFSADYAALFRQAAVYADKLLRGAKPAEMAMAQPDRYDLIVNLRTARLLGITVPPAVVVRASEVIE
ncbi:ABC transporter substrate binding protein [Variovorax rhizosphaerae]|uniref:ABC transporter substrate binding protein n=1 Tax=Variovorax rhizosphaerae TaxID=1836200 RepID=A0ABU8WXR0_9BURK